jgi:uncharacterized sulfatase
MVRRLLLIVLLAFAMPIGQPAAHAASSPERPNIVLLIGDDLGWPYAGFMGDRVARTPNLDALAAGGTVFSEAQDTASVCAPSLRTLLAGIHDDQWNAHRPAIQALTGLQRDRREVAYYWTVPRALAWRGYRTWEGGKLWEGTFRDAGFSAGMATAASRNPFTSVGERFGRDGWGNRTALDPLRAFLDGTGQKPFFTWIAPLLPHGPYDAPEEFRQLYQNRDLTLVEAAYYANVSWFDAFVGAVVAEIEARGLRDDTLLVYLSDNGISIDHPFPGRDQGKGTMGELGFRTPLILNWPGHVPAGQVRTDLVSELDVPATILDYAGADPIVGSDGRSLRSAVEHGSAVGRDEIVGHFVGSTPANSGFFARTQTWRYVRALDHSERLYAIATDPFERTDVSSSHADLVAAFRADVVNGEKALFKAPPELDVAGRLTDLRGAAIAGEEMLLTGRARDGVAIRLLARTGPGGDFRLLAVPHGSYVLRSGRHVPLRLGHVNWWYIPLRLPLGGLGAFFPLEAAPRAPAAVGTSAIRGTLRDPSGRPLDGRAVAIRRRDRPFGTVAVALSAADGRYRAENLPSGSYEVRAAGGPRAHAPRAHLELDADDTATVDLETAR